MILVFCWVERNNGCVLHYLLVCVLLSPQGEAFKAAQRLVLLAVRSMPKTKSWRFNVCKFGTGSVVLK